MEEKFEKIRTGKYPAYKNSGVEWLGEIPEHWKVMKISYLFSKIGSGTTPPVGVSKYYEDGQINWLQTGDLTDGIIESTKKKITGKALAEFSVLRKYQISSLVIAMYGATIGKIGFLNIETTTNQACCVLSDPIDFYTKFGFYWFLGAKPFIISMGYGGGQPNISQDLIKSLRIPIPLFHEQIAIANFLDHKTAMLNNAIAFKEKQIELLKERRQILIHKAVTLGLNPEVKMKERGVEWIGEVPENWEVITIRGIFEERNEPGNDSLQLLSVSIHTAVSSEELSDDENLRGKIRIDDKRNYKRVKPNDIVFNMMRAWQGAIGAVRVDGMVSPAYIVAKPKKEVNSDYLEYLFRTMDFIGQMDRHSKGITDFRKRLYWNEFKQLKVILPPMDVQNSIVEHIAVSSNKINAAVSFKEKEIEKLKEYKATLINSAVTGKVKVR